MHLWDKFIKTHVKFWKCISHSWKTACLIPLWVIHCRACSEGILWGTWVPEYNTEPPCWINKTSSFKIHMAAMHFENTCPKNMPVLQATCPHGTELHPWLHIITLNCVMFQEKLIKIPQSISAFDLYQVLQITALNGSSALNNTPLVQAKQLLKSSAFFLNSCSLLRRESSNPAINSCLCASTSSSAALKSTEEFTKMKFSTLLCVARIVYSWVEILHRIWTGS